MSTILNSFSKLTREKKIDSLLHALQLPDVSKDFLDQFRYNNAEVQAILDELSENTLTNFPSPYGIAPNFLINNKVYHIPMVTEESSVVAAASKAAKIWSERGGFHASVRSTIKTGQVHFIWNGNSQKLKQVFPELERSLFELVSPLSENMRKRGGGVTKIGLIDKTDNIPCYYQLFVNFETIDTMGANFINSCLEAMADGLSRFIHENPDFTGDEKKVEIIMSILSNYNPECLVQAYVECPIDELGNIYPGLLPKDYARRFKLAVDISKSDIYRATTHNKGIFNGIDAIAIATGNDYRALEAGGHAFAARSGHYQGLSTVLTENGKFRFSLELPMTVGSVGGITAVHPLTRLSLRMLGNPNASELMMIIASAGLASNFAAVHALITTGIQKGHMKMHVSNILNQLQANEEQKKAANLYFKDKVVSFREVEKFLKTEIGKQKIENSDF
jgi:hydroxymethylglutaryl-CoA reductase